MNNASPITLEAAENLVHDMLQFSLVREDSYMDLIVIAEQFRDGTTRLELNNGQRFIVSVSEEPEEP